MKRPGFHWAHNYVYDHFGRELGAFGYGVYMGLCRYADNEGRSCFPSYGRIADDLGISRRGVIMAVNKMQALGIIEKAVRLDGGPQLTNVFTLCYDHDMAADRVNKVHPPEETRCTPTGECSAPPPVNVVHPPSVPGAPLYKEVQKDLLKKTQVEEVGAREAREAGPPPPPPPPIACATFEPEPDGV